jgi:hypothetical protein
MCYEGKEEGWKALNMVRRLGLTNLSCLKPTTTDLG